MEIQKQKKIIFGFGGLVLLLLGFLIGSYYSKRHMESSTLSIAIPKDSGVTPEQFEPFWKVWRLLSEKYVAATTTDSQKRIWSSIEGLAQSQGDPYTVFFPPEENTQFKTEIAGNFEGVGMEIGLKDNVLTVIAPVKNSPAEKAGVRAGDKIIKIDDQITLDLGVDKAVKLIRGKKGTSIKITFIREGQSAPIEKTLVRDTIDIPTIQTEIKNGSKTASAAGGPKDTGLRADGIFVIRLFTFTAQAPNLFRNALREFIQSGSHKLIIDLRGNPGGYLDAAWDMASWFLPAGEVIVTEDFGGKGKNQVYRSKGYNIFSDTLQLIVLVDAGSASASEIFAGALQEHGKAKLVGVKTFGKGSVQELVEITPETSLKVTIARWLTPKGHNLSHDGLEPDVKVEVTQKDIEDKKDPQLDKAVEILKAAR